MFLCPLGRFEYLFYRRSEVKLFPTNTEYIKTFNKSVNMYKKKWFPLPCKFAERKFSLLLTMNRPQK